MINRDVNFEYPTDKKTEKIEKLSKTKLKNEKKKLERRIEKNRKRINRYSGCYDRKAKMIRKGWNFVLQKRLSLVESLLDPCTIAPCAKFSGYEMVDSCNPCRAHCTYYGWGVYAEVRSVYARKKRIIRFLPDNMRCNACVHAYTCERKEN